MAAEVITPVVTAAKDQPRRPAEPVFALGGINSGDATKKVISSLPDGGRRPTLRSL
jgi:hypothetical protein